MSKRNANLIFKFNGAKLNAQGVEQIKIHENSSNNSIQIKSIEISFGEHDYLGKAVESEDFVVCVWSSKKQRYVPKMAKMYVMMPKIKKVSTNVSDNTEASKFNDVAEMFGSSKMKRLVKKSKRYTDISTEAVKTISDSISNIVDKYNDSSCSLAPICEDSCYIIPPRNKDATELAQMYDIDDIIPSKLKEVLSQSADEFRDWIIQKINIDDTSSLPSFVINMANQINKFASASNLQETGNLLYWYYNLLFYLAAKRFKIFRMVKRNLQNEVPKRLLRHFKRVYSVDGDINSVMLTKCLCYMCVLSLIINGFQVDSLSLIKDFHTTEDQVKSILREIGCFIDTGAKRKRRNSRL